MTEAPGYQRTLGDRIGADAGLERGAALAGCVLFLPFAVIGYLIGVRVGAGGTMRLVIAIASGAVGGAIVRWVALTISRSSGSAFASFIAPSGGTTPYEQTFSYQESLAARGDVNGALASYEEIIARGGEPNEVRLRCAEVRMQHRIGLPRAVELLRAIQRSPAASPDRRLHASQRLIDVYQVLLRDDGKMMAELRRLIDEHPRAPAAAHARAALARMKAER